MWFILSVLVLLWVVGYMFILGYLYRKNSKPYVSSFLETTYSKIPSSLNASEISVLLYKKIGTEAFIAGILYLIDKQIITVEQKENTYFLTYHPTEPLSFSQKYMITMLFDTLTSIKTVSLDTISHRCDTSSGATNFLLEYSSFQKASYKEIRYRMYEDKKGYTLVTYYGYIGLFLLILNFLLRIHSLPIYILIIPVLFLKVYFLKIYKRTKAANTEYFKWLGFKHYLMNKQEFPKETTHTFYMYATLLGILDIVCKQNQDSHFVLELHKTLSHSLRKAIWEGNRGIKKK
ncbi:MAG: DUF2207 domain-containing protein [Bacilli bacterium]|nr:DUF2207 domain-containing protein [Bacilli bacterium]